MTKTFALVFDNKDVELLQNLRTNVNELDIENLEQALDFATAIQIAVHNEYRIRGYKYDDNLCEYVLTDTNNQE